MIEEDAALTQAESEEAQQSYWMAAEPPTQRARLGVIHCELGWSFQVASIYAFPSIKMLR